MYSFHAGSLVFNALKHYYNYSSPISDCLEYSTLL